MCEIRQTEPRTQGPGPGRPSADARCLSVPGPAPAPGWHSSQSSACSPPQAPQARQSCLHDPERRPVSNPTWHLHSYWSVSFHIPSKSVQKLNSGHFSLASAGHRALLPCAKRSFQMQERVNDTQVLLPAQGAPFVPDPARAISNSQQITTGPCQPYDLLELRGQKGHKNPAWMTPGSHAHFPSSFSLLFLCQWKKPPRGSKTKQCLLGLVLPSELGDPRRETTCYLWVSIYGRLQEARSGAPSQLMMLPLASYPSLSPQEELSK